MFIDKGYNLLCHKPDKIHITIHKPEDEKEVECVING